MVACHECDALYRREAIPVSTRANCKRCGRALYRHLPGAMGRCIALYVSALMLWIMANTLPFLSLRIGGLEEENRLLSGGWALYEFGMPELGVLIVLTGVVFPLVTMSGMLYLLIPLSFDRVPAFRGAVVRAVSVLEPWSMLGVFFLGTLIAIVKLQDLATVIPGMALFAFAGLLLVYSAARASFDPELLWPDMPNLRESELIEGKRLLNCHTCGMLQLDDADHDGCQRCGSSLHHRIEDSVLRTWVLIGAATLMLIPANLYPVMTVAKLGRGEPNTIYSGIVHLIEAGLWGLGLIILFASIVVPIAKLLTLSFPCRRGRSGAPGTGRYSIE